MTMRPDLSLVAALRTNIFKLLDKRDDTRPKLLHDSRIDDNTGRLVLKLDPQYYPWPDRDTAMAAVAKLMSWSEYPVVCTPLNDSEGEFFVDRIYPSMGQVSAILQRHMDADHGSVHVIKIESCENPGFLVTLKIEDTPEKAVRFLRITLHRFCPSAHTIVCLPQPDGRVLVTWAEPDVLRQHSTPPPRGPCVTIGP